METTDDTSQPSLIADLWLLLRIILGPAFWPLIMANVIGYLWGAVASVRSLFGQ